jgi:hypothetical protein
MGQRIQRDRGKVVGWRKGWRIREEQVGVRKGGGRKGYGKWSELWRTERFVMVGERSVCRCLRNESIRKRME